MRHRIGGYRTPRRISPRDIQANADYDLGVVSQWRLQGLDPVGQDIVEIGPGSDLGTGVALLALGAASYTAVDRFPLAEAALDEVHERIGASLGADGRTLRRDIRYVVGELPARRSIPAATTILSNATLEHVEDVERLFEWMAQVSADGARHIHIVDPKTHMRWVRERDPWNILRYPDALYRTFLSYPGAPNRLLLSDYVAAAAQSGIALRIAAEDPVPDGYLRRVRPFVSPKYRRRPPGDLEFGSFTLVGRQEPMTGDAPEQPGSPARTIGA